MNLDKVARIQALPECVTHCRAFFFRLFELLFSFNETVCSEAEQVFFDIFLERNY